jgi:hypothetical protein
MYKSTDAGATWTDIGLNDTRRISRVIVDPSDANTFFGQIMQSSPCGSGYPTCCTSTFLLKSSGRMTGFIKLLRSTFSSFLNPNNLRTADDC